MVDEKTSTLLPDVSIEGEVIEKDKIIIVENGFNFDSTLKPSKSIKTIQEEYNITKAIYYPNHTLSSIGRLGGSSLMTDISSNQWGDGWASIVAPLDATYWEGSEEKAIVLKQQKGEFIRYQWLEDEGEEKYFEFNIQIDEMTKDIALIVTDFAEDEDDKEEGILLWNKEIGNLKNALGI